MSTDPLMSAILNELAAGRIDASEAARRIDALKAGPGGQTGPAGPAMQAEPARTVGPPEDRAEPDHVPTAGAPTGEGGDRRDDPDADPWAAATDRPQHATFARESFGSRGAPEAGPPSGTTPSPADAGVTTRAGGAGSQAGGRGTESRKSTNGVERITVRVVGRRVRIVGETSVATLAADGPHVLRRNGSTL